MVPPVLPSAYPVGAGIQGFAKHVNMKLSLLFGLVSDVSIQPPSMDGWADRRITGNNALYFLS
jgi:hypothetical protein